MTISRKKKNQPTPGSIPGAEIGQVVSSYVNSKSTFPDSAVAQKRPRFRLRAKRAPRKAAQVAPHPSPRQEEPGLLTQLGRGINGLSISMILIALIATLGVTLGSLTLPRVNHAPKPTDDTDKTSYDPRLVTKPALITKASTAKNFQLKNFNPCGNYIPIMRSVGYGPFSERFHQPEHITGRVNSRVDGQDPSVRTTSHEACFWTIDAPEKDALYYVSIQKSFFTKAPNMSDRRKLLTMVNGPDNPPAPGYTTNYSSVKYELRGYSAFLTLAYDDAAKSKVCYFDFPPYLAIGATGQNCEQVRQLVLRLLP